MQLIATRRQAIRALSVLILTVAPDLSGARDAARPSHKAAAEGSWGSYQRPFAADSLWNSRPVRPVLGDDAIPESDFSPALTSGTWSTGVFLSTGSDRPVTLRGKAGSKGVWNADAEEHQEVTIARWPAHVVPDAAQDGHADIVDPVGGIIHSFFQLRQENGQWTAAQYAWTRLDGRGWGDPAHYFQGSRAAAVPAMAGLIRKHEVDDGQPMYRHALAMSLTFNGLSPDPAYVFPATSADANAAATNTGTIPQGALMMLPASFDTQQLSSPALRKVAETLKVYGAYVVDRNHGTPFAIYVENGARLTDATGNEATADLGRIRQALRRVVSVAGWTDGNGKAHAPANNMNLLSMRGPWQLQEGSVTGVFDTWSQSVVFPRTQTRSVVANYSARGLHEVSWAKPVAGARYRLTARTSGGGKLRMEVIEKAAGSVAHDSGELANGEQSTFTWPRQEATIRLRAISGTGSASAVRGDLLRVE